MPDFSIQDRRHLLAAEGWLELGNWNEANEELERIAAEMRGHPDVVEMRYRVYAAAGRWDYAHAVGQALVRMVPHRLGGWLGLAEAERMVAGVGLEKAYETLLAAAGHHPDEPVLHFRIACYACQLGILPAAKMWLGTAFALNPNLRLKALDEPDLELFWRKIGWI